MRKQRESQTEEHRSSVSDCVVMCVFLCVNPCNWVNTIDARSNLMSWKLIMID